MTVVPRGFLVKENNPNLSEVKMGYIVYLRAPNELVISNNKHECDVYKLTKGQLRNLARDAVWLALDSQGRNPQVDQPESD